MSGQVRKGAFDLGVFLIIVGSQVVEPAPPKCPLAYSLILRAAKRGCAHLCLGYPQEIGLTQGRTTAVTVARMLQVNASENDKDPNSFSTSHSDLTQLHPSRRPDHTPAMPYERTDALSE